MNVTFKQYLPKILERTRRKGVEYKSVVMGVCMLGAIRCDDGKQPADLIEPAVVGRAVERGQETGKGWYRASYDAGRSGTLTAAQFRARRDQQDPPDTTPGPSADGMQLFREATLLMKQGTAESRKKAIEKFTAAAAVFQQEGDKPDEAYALGLMAGVYLDLGDVRAAIDRWEKAVTIFHALRDGEAEGVTLVHLGYAYLRLAETQKAQNAFERAVPLLRGTNRVELQANALASLGRIYQQYADAGEAAGDYQRAIGCLQMKAQCQQEARSAKGEAATYIDMARVAQKIPDLQEALTFLERARSLYDDPADKPMQAALHFGFATVYILQQDPEKALPELNQTAALFQELGDAAHEAIVRLTLATQLYRQSREKRLAAENYTRAADLFHGLNRPDKEAECDGKLGEILADLGSEDQAIAYYQHAIALLEAVPNDQELGAAWFGLGWIYDKHGDKDKALSAFLKAQPYLLQAKDSLREKITLLRISTIYDDRHEPDKSLLYDERAAELSKQIGDKKAEAESLYGVAVDLATLRRFREAIEAGDQAAAIWQALDQVKDLGACLLLTGRLRLNLGDERFLKDLKGAVQYSGTAGDFKTEAEALANLGLAYSLVDHFNEARQEFDEALTLAKSIDNAKLEGTLLSNLGLSYMCQGDRQTALEYLLNAQQLQHSGRDRKGEANTLDTLGLLYAELGADEECLAAFQQALALFGELKETRLEANTLNGIGVLHLRLKRNEKAVASFNEAAGLERSLDESEDIALITKANLAFVLDQTGQHKEAQEQYRALQTTLHNLGNRRAEADVWGNLGISYLRAGNYEAARTTLEQSRSLRTTIQDRDGLVLSLSGLAELERTTGNLDAARSLIEKALEQSDWLRNRVTQGDLRAGYSAGLQDLNEFQIALLMQMQDLRPREGFDHLAFEACERGRARTLVELLREARVDLHQGADAASLARLTQLQHELSAKEQFYSSLALGSGSEEALQKLAGEISRLAGESLVIEEEIRKKNPQYASLTGSAPITLSEVQKQLLDRDTLLLEFALGEPTSFLWVVSETEMRSFRLPGRAQIEKLARTACQDLTAELPIYDETSGPAFALSRLLLGEAAPLLVNKRLLIVADGTLNYVPFAALPDPAEFGQPATGDPKPMVLRHEIVCLPSASALLALRTQAAGRSAVPKGITIFADPVFDKTDSRVDNAAGRTTARGAPGGESEVKVRGTLREFTGIARSMRADAPLPRLEGTRAEAMKIAGLLPADSVRLQLDFAASRDVALKADLARYRYVHFATHGVLDSDHPALSALALSLVRPDGTPQDGFLHMSDIFNLKLQAELTTLSGCETGKGKALRGEGVLGLTRGCLYAGSKRVLVSLWKISDQATANLMTNLYSKILNDGETPAAALRGAQIAMLNDPETRAPFYWAAFILQGEWR